MIKSNIFILQFAVIALIALVHITALEMFLYWRFVWLDLVVHFLGGMWISLFSLSVLYNFGFYEYRVPLKVFIAVVFVSLGWELFEVMIGSPRDSNFLFDTSFDLLMDGVGAFAGFMTGRRLIKKETSL